MKSAREALPLCTKLIEGYVNDHSSPSLLDTAMAREAPLSN
jgi:hypothetical protein